MFGVLALEIDSKVCNLTSSSLKNVYIYMPLESELQSICDLLSYPFHLQPFSRFTNGYLIDLDEL
jgi:hypothetical protein